MTRKRKELHLVLKDTEILTFITKEEFDALEWFESGEITSSAYFYRDGVKYLIDSESDMDADYDYWAIYKIYKYNN